MASFYYQLQQPDAWIAAQAYAMRRWVQERRDVLELVLLQPHDGGMQVAGAPIRIVPRA